MDAGELATSILALSNLIKEANHLLNDGKASVKVLVNADIKANCVTIDLSVVWSLAQKLHSLLNDSHVQDAKSLLDWLGVLGLPTGIGLFQYLALKSKKEVESATKITDRDGENVIEVKFVGDNNTVVIAPQVFKLANSKNIVEEAKGVVAPISDKKGVQSATFVHGRSERAIDAKAAKSIREATIAEEVEKPQYIVGHIIVYAPVLEDGAKKWKFTYNGNVENIDISETSIAAETVARGRVFVGDTYKVKMEITEKKIEGGYKNTFKVVEVFDYIPGDEQTRLF